MVARAASLPALRAALDRLNARIVLRLAERACYPSCAPLYEPRFGRLDLAMTSLESHRATILSRLGAGEPGLPGDAPPNVRAIKDHYLWAVSELCRSDDEPDAYAEIVMLDADLITLIVDRVSIGNAVARAKLAAMPELVAAPFDAPRARAALVVPAREAQVIAQAMHLGERLHMNVGPLSTLFRSIIDETVDVELRLLAGIAAQEQA